MQGTIKVLITATVLIGILIHLSEQSLLWDIVNRGRALFAEGQYPSSRDRILSNNIPGTDDDSNYEKATHREVASSERFGSNNYDRVRQQEYPQYSQQQRPSASESHSNHYKENDGYYGKYIYSQQSRYPSSLNFYSFLGGLSFASLLATTLIVFSRRNGSLFRTFEDDDLYRRNFKTNFDWDLIPKTFLKLIDHPDDLWKKEKHTKKST